MERTAPAGAAAGAAGSAARALRPAAQGTVAPGRDPPGLSLPPTGNTGPSSPFVASLGAPTLPHF